MKRVLELTKWTYCGKGEAEQYAEKLSNGNRFNKLDSVEINKLFKLKEIPVQVNSVNDYYVYYNYHHSSGHDTELYINDDDEIKFQIIEPTGGALSAFFSEVIIFTITDRF